jgi:hypothetical protein
MYFLTPGEDNDNHYGAVMMVITNDSAKKKKPHKSVSSLHKLRPSSYGSFFGLRPLLNLSFDSFDNVRLRTRLSKSLDKVTFGIHEVKKDRVVDEVVVAWFGTWWRREIYSVRLARCLGRRVVSC